LTRVFPRGTGTGRLGAVVILVTEHWTRTWKSQPSDDSHWVFVWYCRLPIPNGIAAIHCTRHGLANHHLVCNQQAAGSIPGTNSHYNCSQRNGKPPAPIGIGGQQHRYGSSTNWYRWSTEPIWLQHQLVSVVNRTDMAPAPICH
jgi:hypothetical protein